MRGRFVGLLIVGACVLHAACTPVAGPSGPAPATARTAPESRAGHHLRALVDAINTGDSAAIARFTEEHYDDEYLLEYGAVARAQQRWLEIHHLYGPLQLDTLALATDTEADAWVRGSVTGAWLRFLISADSLPPHRMTRVRMGRGLTPAHAGTRHPPLDDAGLARHLEAHLGRMAREGYFSGTVLVARHGRPLFQRAYGFADRGGQSRNRLETRFDLASVGKLFTAVAIAQLAEAGKLSFGDTIARFLPELPRSLSGRITVAHLLEHSSGLGELGPSLDAAMARTRTVGEMLALLRDTAPEFAPGSRFQYSNRGYIVLGAIVERASGMDYFEYLRRHVFEPAGMRETGFFAEDDAVAGRAVRYTFYPTLRSPFVAGPRVESTARLDFRGGPAGGAYSTVGDLARFTAALESGRLLRRETFARMLERRPDHPYGYGFEADGPPVRSWGHAGAAPGATANLRVYPQAGYTVAVLSNYDVAANQVGAYIRELIDR